MKKLVFEKSDCWPYADGKRRFVTRDYTGRRKDLQGRNAIIIRSFRRDYVLAQFGTRLDSNLEPVYDPLCFGWHLFKAIDFRSKGLRNGRK